MDTLYYVGLPLLFVGSYLCLRRSNITKHDYLHYSLYCIDTLSRTYNYVETTIIDIFNNYIKKNYKPFEIIDANMFVDGKTELVYHYNDQIYNIFYDTTYPLYTTSNVGDILDIKDIIITPNNSKIILIEYVHNKTNHTIIIDDIVKKYIMSLAGPNENFYNRNEQPVYISTIMINSDILKDIDNYSILITYLDMKTITKKINII